MEGQGVRSTPSASNSSLPTNPNLTRIECDTAAARYHRVTPGVPRPDDPHVVSRERSVVPVPELSQTEERIVLLVAQERSRREIAAESDSTYEPSTGTSRKRTGSSRRHRHSSIES